MKKLNISWFTLLWTVATTFNVSQSVNPYDMGDMKANATTIFHIQAVQLEYNLRVFAPNETGMFHAVYFLSGFDGIVNIQRAQALFLAIKEVFDLFPAIIPPHGYETMLTHVASHGYVVLAPERIQDPFSALNASWIDDVDTWAQDHLLDRLLNNGKIKNSS